MRNQLCPQVLDKNWPSISSPWRAELFSRVLSRQQILLPWGQPFSRCLLAVVSPSPWVLSPESLLGLAALFVRKFAFSFLMATPSPPQPMHQGSTRGAETGADTARGDEG